MLGKSNKSYLLFFIIVVSLGLFSFIAISNFLIVKTSDKIVNLNYGIDLQNYVRQNNLSIPFPFSYTEYGVNDINGQLETYKKYMSLDFKDFQKVLKKNYFYHVDSYNCRYWAYIWSLYWKENKDKYNWDMNYIYTDNHIFLMVYNETGYCIMDGDEVICLNG